MGHSAEVDRSVAKKRHDLLHNLPGILNVPVIAPNVAHLSNPGVVRLQRTGGRVGLLTVYLWVIYDRVGLPLDFQFIYGLLTQLVYLWSFDRVYLWT